MELSIEAILFYLVLCDAIIVSIIAYSKLNILFRDKIPFFPITRGWAIAYVALVLWVGYGLLRLGII
jgi:hypothetical protein